MKLREIGEDRLLAQLLPRLRRSSSVVRGTGDDCAVVRFPKGNRFQVLKTDSIVETVHFRAATSPALVGWKAMARPLSDFAAVAGVPQFALVTLIVPGEQQLGWVKKLYHGLEKVARGFDVVIVGGETSSCKGPAMISVSLSGFVERDRWVSRSGGKAGDYLFVTGHLGGSLGGRHLRFVPRIKEARWLTKHFRIHAMIDLSDGLGTDLPRLADASGVGFEIDPDSVPRNRGCSLRQALSDGEDYELLFAIPPEVAEELQRRWQQHWPLKLTRIGCLTKTKRVVRNLPGGYVHFQ